MIITHNLMAMNAQRQNNIVSGKKSRSSEKLSSGYKINRAADDAAGLAISEKMRKQIRGLARGVENTQDGVSLCQVADGALHEVTDMLHRMTELVIQAANGTNSVSDRQAIQNEIDELRVEIDRIGHTTTFNQKPIFDGDTLEPEAIMRQPLSSDSIDTGHLSNVYQSNDGRYFPAAILDLSGVNENNIETLAGRSISINCIYACGETSSITFANGGGCSAADLNGKVDHSFTVDITGISNGQQLASRIMETLQAYPTSVYTDGSIPNRATIGGAVPVCHSTQVLANGSQLIIASENAEVTESAARATAASFTGAAGEINLSAFSYETLSDWRIRPTQNQVHIMPGNEPGSGIPLCIDRMNAGMLGLNHVSAMSERQATDSILFVNKALEAITTNRSKIGAYQNRLEHTIANESNIVENTQAAESRIRDTDMAEEMVNYSLQNILLQAGQSMMAQANNNTDSVMSLLQ